VFGTIKKQPKSNQSHYKLQYFTNNIISLFQKTALSLKKKKTKKSKHQRKQIKNQHRQKYQINKKKQQKIQSFYQYCNFFSFLFLFIIHHHFLSFLNLLLNVKLNVKLILFVYYNHSMFVHLQVVYRQISIFVVQEEYLLYLEF